MRMFLGFFLPAWHSTDRASLRDADDHGIFPTDRASLTGCGGSWEIQTDADVFVFFLPTWQSTDRASLTGCGWSWEFQMDADDHGIFPTDRASLTGCGGSWEFQTDADGHGNSKWMRRVMGIPNGCGWSWEFQMDADDHGNF